MSKTNFKHILCSFVVAGFLFMAFGSNDEDKIEDENVQSEIKSKQQSYVIDISATQLYQEYESNGVAADLKYEGELLRVRGIVNSIDRGFTGNIYVTLKGNEYFGAVQCFFADENANMAAQLSKGQWVTIIGLCQGKIMNVLLKDCIVQ